MSSGQTRAAAYLRALDRAARWLPRSQAAELHEQIAAHLADALPSDPDDSAVDKVVAELGDPRTLVRQAAGDHPRLRIRLRRVRLWTWAIAACVLAAAVTATGLAVAQVASQIQPANLQCSCGEMLVYRKDRLVEHDESLGGVDVMQAPARSSRQGFEFDVANFTKVPQTILGLPPNYGPWGVQSHVYKLRIGAHDEHGFPLTDRTFTAAPVTLPPGGNRAIKIEWNHLHCSSPRTEEILTAVELRVQVGSLIRVERIPLASRIVITVPRRVPHPAANSCQATRQGEH